MDWLKKGPELKLPSLRRSKKEPSGSGSGPRGPQFLTDLYYDLQDRRLLPLIALVVVAIAAVPFLLGDSEEVSAPTPTTDEAATASGFEGASELTVVRANPGLRDYKKRLKGRSPSNPFKQQYRPEVSEGGDSEGGDTSAPESLTLDLEDDEGDTFEIGPLPAPGPSSPPSGGGGRAAPNPNDPGLRYFGFRPDVRFGAAGSGKLKNYEMLDIGTRLPQKKPVLVFLGVSDDGRRATFAVTSEVILVRGDGQCIGGAQACGLLSLKPGDAVDLLTGVPDRTFRLSLTKIDWVEVDPPEPPKANKSDLEPFLDISQSFSK
jgi:hypothetical protein